MINCYQNINSEGYLHWSKKYGHSLRKIVQAYAYNPERNLSVETQYKYSIYPELEIVLLHINWLIRVSPNFMLRNIEALWRLLWIEIIYHYQAKKNSI